MILYNNIAAHIPANSRYVCISGYFNSYDRCEKIKLLANGHSIGASKCYNIWDEQTQKLKQTGFIILGDLASAECESQIDFTLEVRTNETTHKHNIGVSTLEVIDHKIENNQTNNIAVLLPTYNPELDQLKRQLESLKNQSKNALDIYIRDDASSIESKIGIKKLVSEYTNVYFSENQNNLGFYYNIQSMISSISASYEYIALSDQDDYWMPDKIERQLQLIKNKEKDLVYSDLQIVDRNLNIIDESFWTDRSNHFNHLNALSIQNVATGSTMFFKAGHIKNILPFPPKIGRTFHDHWICYITALKHKIDYTNMPLVKYIQHKNNVVGFRKFKEQNIVYRTTSFLSLLIILCKLLLKSDLSNLGPFILEQQKIYATNLQRLKGFYLCTNQIDILEFQTRMYDLKTVIKLMWISIKKNFSDIKTNRSEVALYTAILTHLALQLRKKVINEK